MLFGRRNKKKSNDRVLDLKARVEALRAADESTREKPRTLERFLKGDDVLTGREVEDEYTPTGFDASAPSDADEPPYTDSFEVNLQAELEKYILRQEARGHAPEVAGDDGSPDDEDWPFEGQSPYQDKGI